MTLSVPMPLLKWQEDFARKLKGDEIDSLPRGFLPYKLDYWGQMQKFLDCQFASLAKLLAKDYVWTEQIAIPFIDASPPLTWDLEEWCKKLPEWLLQNQKESLSPLLFPLLELELLRLEVFSSPSLSLPAVEELGTAVFYLQPHLRFLFSGYPLLAIREALLQDKPYQMGEGNWVAVSLDAWGNVILTSIDYPQKTFLEIFHGRTLEQAFAYAEETHPLLLEQIAPHIGLWTSQWIHLGWLGVK